MIIFSDKTIQTRDDMLDTNWFPPDLEQPLYVVPDGTPLADKIMRLFPFFEFVTDADGALVDVTPTEPPAPEPPPTIGERLSAVENAMLEVLGNA